MNDPRIAALLEYVEVLEDCVGAALAMLAAPNQEALDEARAGLNDALERGPRAKVAAAAAGVEFPEQAPVVGPHHH